MAQKNPNEHEIQKRSKDVSAEEKKRRQKETRRLQNMEKEKQRIENELYKRHIQQQKIEMKAELLSEKARKKQELKEKQKMEKETGNGKAQKCDSIFEIFACFKKREKAGGELDKKSKKSKNLDIQQVVDKSKGSNEKIEAERLRVNEYQRKIYERNLNKIGSQQRNEKKQRLPSDSESSIHESDLELKWCGACKRPKKKILSANDGKDKTKMPPIQKEEIREEPKLKRLRDFFDIPKEISKPDPKKEVTVVPAAEPEKIKQKSQISLPPMQYPSPRLKDEVTLVTPTLSLENQDIQKKKSVAKDKVTSSAQTDMELFPAQTAKPSVSKKEAIIQTDDIPEIVIPSSSIVIDDSVEARIYVRDQKIQTEPFDFPLSDSTEKILIPTGQAYKTKIIDKTDGQKESFVNAESQTSFCNCFAETSITAANLRETISKRTGENVIKRSIAAQTEVCACNCEESSSASSCYLLAHSFEKR